MKRIPDQSRFNEYLRSAENALSWLYDAMEECKYDLEYVELVYKNFVAAYNLVQRLILILDYPAREYNHTSLSRVEHLRRCKLRVVDTFNDWKKKALSEDSVSFVDDLPF